MDLQYSFHILRRKRAKIDKTLKGSFFGGSVVKNLPAVQRRLKFSPWVGKIPWRRAWQTTPVFLPGKCHGQRSLAGYRPWDLKESDMTEATARIHTHTHTHV